MGKEMNGIFDDLKSKGTRLAVKRSIYGLIGAFLLFVLFYLNVFGLENDGIDRFRPYILIMVALIAVASIANWIRASRNNLMHGIEKFCNGSDVMMARMERTWNDGFDFGQGRMDSEFIISLKGFRSKVIPLEGIVFAQKRYHNIGSGGASNEIVLIDFYSKYSKNPHIDFEYKEQYADNLLGYIMANCRDIAVDFEAIRNLSNTTQAAKLYAGKDWDSLREYAHAQRQSNAIQRVADLFGIGSDPYNASVSHVNVLGLLEHREHFDHIGWDFSHNEVVSIFNRRLEKMGLPEIQCDYAKKDLCFDENSVVDDVDAELLSISGKISNNKYTPVIILPEPTGDEETDGYYISVLDKAIWDSLRPIFIDEFNFAVIE